MPIAKFFHHLFTPHCPDCLAESVCESCENLREELAHERAQNKQLIDTIINFNKPPVPIIQSEEKELKPIGNRLSWNARRQLLEQEDARAAQVTQEKKLELKSIEELEQELGVNNG